MKDKELKKIKRELHEINKQMFQMRLNKSFGLIDRTDLHIIKDRVNHLDSMCNWILGIAITISVFGLCFGLVILYCVS